MENPQEQPQMPVTPAVTEAPHAAPTDKEKALGAIAYLGPLFIVSFILGSDSKFVKFHAVQALTLFVVLFVVRIVLGALFWNSFAYGYGMMWGGGSLMMLINFVAFLAAIMALIKAAMGQQWEIPGIGALAKKIKL